MKKIFLLSMVVLAVAWIGATGAQAALIWQAHGYGSDGGPENGRALFAFTTPGTLSITLENMAGPSQLGAISSVLDGLAFTLSGPSTIRLTGAHAAGVVTATKGLAFYDPPGGITEAGSHPFGWTVRQDGDTWFLSAGDGTFKPYGIVNHNVTATDGITNKKHNPYLDGPVTFDFTLAGLTHTPDVTSVNLYFGTRPDIQSAAPVPVPGSLLLLGSGLIGFVTIRRRMGKGNGASPAAQA